MRNSVATFAYVALRERFKVDMNVNDIGLRDVEFAGPSAPGETIELVHDLGEATYVLLGRALDTHGEPLPHAELFASLGFAGEPRWSGSSLAAGAEGGFALVLQPGFAGKTLEHVDLDLVPYVDGRSQSAGLGARVALEPAAVIAPGVRDLGDVTFDEPPLLVAGTIVDDAGTPQSAELHVTRALHPGERVRDPRTLRVETLFHAPTPGAFALRAHDVPAGDLLLHVAPGSLLPPPPVPFTAGAQDLRIVLQRGGSVDLCARVDASLREQDVHTTLHSGDGPRLKANAPRREGDNLHFWWRVVPPGTYRLEVALDGVAEPVMALDGLAVPRGVATDPRLHGVDLTHVRAPR